MEPKSVELVSERELHILWRDGIEQRLNARDLRLACPCAQCIEEWTGRALLDPSKVSPHIGILACELVGRYALNFRFGDGHQTGIYAFEYLRRLTGAGS